MTEPESNTEPESSDAAVTDSVEEIEHVSEPDGTEVTVTVPEHETEPDNVSVEPHTEVHVPEDNSSAIVQIMENYSELRTENEDLRRQMAEAHSRIDALTVDTGTAQETADVAAAIASDASAQAAEANTPEPTPDTPPKRSKKGGGWLFGGRD